MRIPRYVAGMFLIVFVGLGADMVSGQDYPNKPIRVIASGAGGGTDFSARLVAQALSGSLGQQVVVENRGDNIAQETVAKAPPDVYILLATGSGFWVTPLMQKTPYDPVRDFSPITLVTTSPNILVVHPSLPVKSVKELVALARARPGELYFSSAGVGGSAHLAAELFKAIAAINIVHVPYKGGGPALFALIGGEAQLMFPNAGAVAPHARSGRLRALAVGSTHSSALFPELPTVAAAGLPGYEAVSMVSMFAPPKTPAAIIGRLNQEIVRVLNRAEVKEKFIGAGVETAGSSPEQLAATMKSEMARLGKVIRDAGIRAD